jgi:hypothetical protein
MPHGHIERSLQSTMSNSRPLALVVFLENVGHIQGMNLPQWAMNIVDFVSEEYAKTLLHLYGAHRRYDRVVILEDERATGPELVDALLSASRTHRVDLLLLVHGHEGCLVGYRAKKMVGAETFKRLRNAYDQDSKALDLRMIYGLNCFGASLASTWVELGAEVVNGAVGVNWFPEPSLSVFLRNWLGGKPYSLAVRQSNRRANQVWYRLLRSTPEDAHSWIISSRQIIFGHADITITG